MHNSSLKNKVVVLRGKGMTFVEIQQCINKKISKSTLSGWCKDVILPKSYKKKIRLKNLKTLKKARLLAIEVNKKKQEDIINAFLRRNKKLSKHINIDICKMMLSFLYLGEGSKHISTRTLRLGSSSVFIIKVYLKLLNKCFNIDDKKFRVTVLCRADQNIPKLEKFWQKITKIKKEQFYKTRIDKRTIGKKTLKKDYMGVCVIDYFDTKIQLELESLPIQVATWL